MFERFKPYELSGIREETQVLDKNEMVTLDFLCAMILLARITNDEKLKLLFDLFDDDDDGCMTPEDILQML